MKELLAAVHKERLANNKSFSLQCAMDSIEMNRELIKRAGGPSAVGKLFGITGQAVSGWCINGIPADRVIPISDSTNWQVTPHELRPDIYRHPDDGLPDHLRGKQKEAA